MEGYSHKIDYAKELNEAQLEAVMYQDGPSLVIAGAGSGKTRVLTYKIAYLLEQGVAPWNILALTFTNKAAREMTVRIGRLVGEELTHDLWAGTFHSIFARLLRREAERIGFTPNFTIYDTADSRQLVKAIVKEMHLDEKKYKAPMLCGRISDAKNRLILPDDYLASREMHERDEKDEVPLLGKIYETYAQRCHQANALDFDDLLLQTYLLLKHNEDVRDKYRRRFPYILVDEYQDTNYAQYRIISLLTQPDSRLCVVGDDAQSIYAFRGADIGNILSFSQQYPTMRLIKLERNYRSTKNIVNAANSIIAHNQGRIPKNVYSEEPTGERLQLMETASDRDESAKVAREVNRLHRKAGIGYDDIAVLFRTNAQSRSFEDAFRTVGIPYRVYGNLSFYQRKEIKDVIAYLRLTVNPLDEEALLRIINYPARGIGQTTVGKLQMAAAQHVQPLWNILCNPQAYGVVVNRGTAEKLYGFAILVQSFRERQAETPVYDMVEAIIKESGIAADINQDNSTENKARQENVEELLNSIRDFEEDRLEQQGQEKPLLADYLPQVALLTDQDQREDGEPKVTLMTIHAAKGLEYRAVFVTGLENDLFPNASARFFPKEMEEERRLFYVAVTRAKEYCYLTYAKTRYRFGSLEYGEKSRFVDEIDAQYIVTTREAAEGESAFTRPRRSFFSSQERRDSIAGASAATPVRRSFPTPSATAAQRTTAASQRPASASQRPAGKFRRYHEDVPPATAPVARQHDLDTGNLILHERFGRGRVLSLQGDGPSAKAVIEFENVGTKTLLLKFAKYEKI
ncbi:MAG: UvrD-helicase domain-containing protein [Alloprevotella sp.]|nr:UvrD-helicase domain-containing protein [Alloprevotella sp.]